MEIVRGGWVSQRLKEGWVLFKKLSNCLKYNKVVTYESTKFFNNNWKVSIKNNLNICFPLVRFFIFFKRTKTPTTVVEIVIDRPRA